MESKLILQRNRYFKGFWAVAFVLSIWYHNWQHTNLITLFILIAAAYSFISALTWRVTADDDEIIVRRFLFRKTLDMGDITHFTERRSFHGDYMLKVYISKRMVLRVDSGFVKNYMGLKFFLLNEGIHNV